MSDYDIVCIGNAKLDIFLLIHDSNKHFHLNPQTNELSVKSGDKIRVDKSLFLPGGNAANVAAGLSRIGLKTSIFAEIGDDELSQKIINSLKEKKVETKHIQQTKGGEASFSVILSYKNERTIFSQHATRNHNFKLENIVTKWIFLTSIGNDWKNAYKHVGDYVRKMSCHLAFNPGTLQIDAGYAEISAILKLTDILFVNKEEAIKILNIKDQKSNINDLLSALQKLGPKSILITDGKNGSYMIDEHQKIFQQSALPCEIVEKTGAGDAYTSGFLSATLQNLSKKEAMRWGAMNSSAVIGKIGAEEGLLTKEQIKQ